MKNLIKNNSELIAHYKKYKEFLKKENSFFSLQQIEHCNQQIAILINQIEQFKRENPYRGYNREKREVEIKHEPFTKVMCY
jgi:hypothetical protein